MLGGDSRLLKERIESISHLNSFCGFNRTHAIWWATGRVRPLTAWQSRAGVLPVAQQHKPLDIIIVSIDRQIEVLIWTSTTLETRGVREMD